MFEIHIANPDYVAIKTGLRQLASRLDIELKAAGQWSALAENRGITEVAAVLESVIKSLESAVADAEKAAEIVAGAQKKAPHEH